MLIRTSPSIHPRHKIATFPAVQNQLNLDGYTFIGNDDVWNITLQCIIPVSIIWFVDIYLLSPGF